METLLWIREVKAVYLPIGYGRGDDSATTKELNELLAEGWKLIAIFSDQKYSLEFRGFITNQYAVVGR